MAESKLTLSLKVVKRGSASSAHSMSLAARCLVGALQPREQGVGVVRERRWLACPAFAMRTSAHVFVLSILLE